MTNKDNKLDIKKMTGQDQDYSQFVNNDQRQISDEVSMLAISELFDKRKLKTNSRVKFEQVQILAKLYMFTQVFGEKYTKNLADEIMMIQVSVGGLGRKEIVQMIQQRSVFDAVQEPMKSKDIFR